MTIELNQELIDNLYREYILGCKIRKEEINIGEMNAYVENRAEEIKEDIKNG